MGYERHAEKGARRCNQQTRREKQKIKDRERAREKEREDEKEETGKLKKARRRNIPKRQGRQSLEEEEELEPEL